MNGVINIYKNKGMTSFDVVRKVKKVANTGKVGHTGTLDPEAEGVLPVCIGKATKIIDYIMNSNKEYVVEFRLGFKTTTYDLEGEVLAERDYSNIKTEDVLAAIDSFRGEYMQVPPMYSALKQNGVRLYELARKGIEVEREARKVNIYNIKDIEIEIPNVKMIVECSKGTYIRSLCYDIGEKLEVFATMTGLKRSRTSVFSEKASINIDDLTEENISENIISIDDALEFYDKLIIKDSYQKFLVNGVRLGDKRFSAEKIIINKLYRVYNEQNHFLGLGRGNEDGFKIEKLLMD